LKRPFHCSFLLLLLLLTTASTPVLAADIDIDATGLPEQRDQSSHKNDGRDDSRFVKDHSMDDRGDESRSADRRDDSKAYGNDRSEDRSKDDGKDDGKYDGSEFKAKTFIDTSFEKETYRDLFRSSKETDRSPKPGDERDISAYSEDGMESSDGEDKKPDRRKKGDLLSERTGPVHELPGDWVPDKIDLTSNGGFELSPDNGSPVPYRLNGHIDIQRGRPWEAH
jgi:hypothetical protein